MTRLGGSAKVSVQAGINGHGLEAGAHAGLGVIHGLDDAFECGVECLLSLLEQIEGAGVAIDHGTVAQVVVAADVFDRTPAEDLVFDVFTIGMLADCAETLVTGNGRGVRRRVLVFC